MCAEKRSISVDMVSYELQQKMFSFVICKSENKHSVV